MNITCIRHISDKTNLRLESDFNRMISWKKVWVYDQAEIDHVFELHERHRNKYDDRLETLFTQFKNDKLVPRDEKYSFLQFLQIVDLRNVDEDTLIETVGKIASVIEGERGAAAKELLSTYPRLRGGRHDDTEFHDDDIERFDYLGFYPEGI